MECGGEGDVILLGGRLVFGGVISGLCRCGITFGWTGRMIHTITGFYRLWMLVIYRSILMFVCTVVSACLSLIICLFLFRSIDPLSQHDTTRHDMYTVTGG